MRTIACGSNRVVVAVATFMVLLTAGRAGAQPAPSPGRSVLLVGNSVNGTVSVLDDDGRTFQNLGTINVIPDLRKRMIRMNLLIWPRLAYGFVKHRQLIKHGEPDHGNRFVDDLFLSPD